MFIFCPSNLLLKNDTNDSYLKKAGPNKHTEGYFYLINQPNTPKQIDTRGSVYIKCSVVQNILMSSVKSELGAMFKTHNAVLFLEAC